MASGHRGTEITEDDPAGREAAGCSRLTRGSAAPGSSQRHPLRALCLCGYESSSYRDAPGSTGTIWMIVENRSGVAPGRGFKYPPLPSSE